MKASCSSCSSQSFTMDDGWAIEHESGCPFFRKMWYDLIDGSDGPAPGVILIERPEWTSRTFAHSLADPDWMTCPECLAQSLIDQIHEEDGLLVMPLDHWPGCSRWEGKKAKVSVAIGEDLGPDFRMARLIEPAKSDLFSRHNPRF